MKIFRSLCILLTGLLMATGLMANQTVTISTNLGDIVVELNEASAPKTTANFLSYVNDKFYDGTIFHRVIPNFMIQGGGFTENMTQKETKPAISFETNNLKNMRGSIAMARTNDPNSATSQFFINLKDNSFLDTQYVVFGTVTKGMDVVDAIAAVPTASSGPHQNVPEKAVVIESIKVVNSNNE